MAMIRFTEDGLRAVKHMAERSESRELRIERDEEACASCGDILRVNVGGPKEGDDVIPAEGLFFSINLDLELAAVNIVIDASGKLPVVHTRFPTNRSGGL